MERISEYTVYHSGNIQALRCTVQKVTPAAAAPHPISPEMLRIVRIVSGACTWVILTPSVTDCKPCRHRLGCVHVGDLAA